MEKNEVFWRGLGKEMKHLEKSNKSEVQGIDLVARYGHFIKKINFHTQA